MLRFDPDKNMDQMNGIRYEYNIESRIRRYMEDLLWTFYKFFAVKEILSKQFTGPINHCDRTSTKQPDIDKDR